MKKKIILAAIATLFTLTAFAQGKFETRKVGNFTLHVYNSGDVMADASYIVEGKKGLVILEEPLFKANASAFDTYVKKLKKPVEARITNYHEGATGSHVVIQPEGMHKFMHEGVYDAMMKGFQQSFGDKMAERPTGKAKEVAFGKSVTIDGVVYRFDKGPDNDFPAAQILIGKQVVLMHWAPAKAHMNNLQLANREAVAQALKGLKAAKATGARFFIGGHGGLSTVDALDFRIQYLEKMETLLRENGDASAFVAALKKAYPNLTGAEGLEALAKNLYQ